MLATSDHTEPEQQGTPGGRLGLLLRLVPYGFAVLVFAPMLHNSFWLDDYGWVATAIRATDDPTLLFETQAGFVRPVVNAVFMVNFLVFRLEPEGYYLVNLLLHLANVALVYQLAARLAGGRWLPAWLAALLFAGAVGNYGEAVFWIAGRTELVATAFYLGALLAFWSFLRSSDEAAAGQTPSDLRSDDPRRVRLSRRGAYFATLVCFGLALLSKESAVTLLPALMLLEWLGATVPLRSMLSVRRGLKYIPFAFLLIPYTVYELSVQRSNVVVEQNQFSIGWHAVPNLVEYLTLMLLPITSESTVVDVSGKLGAALDVVQLILAIACVGGWGWLLASRVPARLKFTVLWMVLAIVPYAFFTSKTTTRYLYIPSIGAIIAAATLADLLWRRSLSSWSDRTLAVRLAAAALVALLAAQWLVINVVIRQWHSQQAAQDPALYRSLVELARSLGY